MPQEGSSAESADEVRAAIEGYVGYFGTRRWALLIPKSSAQDVARALGLAQ